MPPSVAVLGGGMAGLAAAMRLREAELRTVVYESSDRPGGVVGSFRHGEWLVETGPTFLPPLPKGVEEMLRRSGIELDRVHPGGRQRRYLRTADRIVPVPESPGELVASPLLSMAGRMRLLREPFIERGGFDDESVRAFGARRFGPEMTGMFLEPAVAASTGGDPARLLAKVVIPQMVEAEQRSGSVLRGRLRAAKERRRNGGRVPAPWAMRGGMQGLVDAVVGSMPGVIRLRSPAAGLVAAGGGFDVTGSDGGVEHFDAVVIAVPVPRVVELLAALSEARSMVDQARMMPHADAVSIWLGFPPGGFPEFDGAAVIASSGLGSAVMSAGLQAGSMEGRTPPGGTQVAALLGGVSHSGVTVMPADELVAEVEAFLAPLGTWGHRPEVLGTRCWPGGLPQFEQGYDSLLDAVEVLEREVAGVAICGAWRSGATVGQVMAGGLEAADRVVALMAGRQR